MSDTAPTPAETARWAARAGLALPAERHAAVAAVAAHIHDVVSVLRELDFADVPPASVYQAEEHSAHRPVQEQEQPDAAV